ncbi:MAG: hypothetical protein J07HN4v3_02086 [Halonotius sp. J07HN4]|nr:MAG: hypothetical protein J07HN4v3_02086 [Halonotius sp. J07HN4]
MCFEYDKYDRSSEVEQEAEEELEEPSVKSEEPATDVNILTDGGAEDDDE